MLHRRPLRQIILVLLGALLVYLIGIGSVSLWDRDEPRYAQTSAQMLASGDWVVPRLLDEVRTAKPIFIYWCQAAAMRLFGVNERAARLPSVAGIMLTLILLAAVIWRTIGPRRAVWTVLILSTAGLTLAAAKMCLTDAVLLLFITAAQLCLCAMYVQRDSGPAQPQTRSLIPANQAWRMPLAAVMWIAIGLAVLTKGPVVLGVQIMTILVLLAMDWKLIGAGWWRSIHPVMGIGIVLLICGPWAYLIHQREPTFFATVIGHDVINRMRTGLEGHKGPPGYYLLTIWATFFPWSLLLPAAIVSGWRNRRVPQIRFALAAVIGPWILFEIVQTKLPHYLLPAFPALAFLTADMLIRAARGRWFADRGFLRAVLIWGGIAAVIGLAPWASLAVFPAPPLPAIGAMVLLPIVAFGWAGRVYLHFRAARPLNAAALMGIGMMLTVAIFHGLYLPNAPFLRMSSQLAAVLREHEATGPGQAIMIGYKETSLPFYQGGTIRPQRDNKFLQNTPPSGWPGWIVISDAIWRRMPPDVQKRLDLVATVRGLNYAGSDADGRHIVSVHVLHNPDASLSPR